MNETQLIRHVARLAPWLAPLPGAYFIARSSWLHLLATEPQLLRIAVALVIGLVVEMVSLAGFHTRLDLDRWNRIAQDRNWSERAPVKGVTWAIGIYFAGVILLLVVLEAVPQASGLAPVFMPFLGVAGALILSSIGQHSDRKDRYNVDDSLRMRKAEGKRKAEGNAEAPRKAERRKAETENRKTAVLAEWPDLLIMPTKQAAELAGVTERTIRNWRNNNGAHQ